MRMSRSPQNGGFQRSTGGGPLLPARASAPVIASRPDCPSFAMVCLEPTIRTWVRGQIIRGIAITNPAAVFQVVIPVDEESAQALRYRGLACILHDVCPIAVQCWLRWIRG